MVKRSKIFACLVTTMAATRSMSRRSWALLTALMVFSALVVPVFSAQPANAIPPLEHARTAHLNKPKHVSLGGGRRSLKVSGTLTTDGPGFLACSAEQPVDVQIRAGGSWITRKSDTTNSNGKFSVLIRDIAAKYRAVAPKTALAPFPPVLDLCLRAVSNVRRHRHG